MAEDSRYLPAGVRVDPYAGNEPLLDPDLEKVRDEEAKALSEIKIEARPEPTIDPELVKAREAELARDAKRAKEAGLDMPTFEATDSVAQTAEEPAPAPKTTAKKATSKKSSK